MESEQVATLREIARVLEHDARQIGVLGERVVATVSAGTSTAGWSGPAALAFEAAARALDSETCGLHDSLVDTGAALRADARRLELRAESLESAEFFTR